MSKIMQMCADEIAGYLKRIADLEAKLAESEEEIKIVREQNGRVIEKLDLIVRSNQDLEKQLAEKDKLINDYADEHAMLQYKIAHLAVKEIKAEDFAIDILEELDGSSNYINSKLDFECGFYISQKTIRDKIKHLKGEENV